MAANTARPLAPREPFLVIRTVSTAVLKYQINSTGFSKPEGVIVSSQAALRGVAVREEPETTGVTISLIE